MSDENMYGPVASLIEASKDHETEKKKRRGVARGLKSLNRSGKLTSDLLKEARQRSGVSDNQFDSFLKRNKISVSEEPEPTALADSPEEAAQNVSFNKQFGSGLDTLSGMQDPNYELGSGSSLRQPARQIGTRSGALRRAARRLRKDGYSGQAGQLAMMSELQRLKEPRIASEATRRRDMAQRIMAGRLMKQENDLLQRRNEFMSKMYDRGIGFAEGEESDDSKDSNMTEFARREDDFQKRKRERDSLFGNRLNATRNR